MPFAFLDEPWIHSFRHAPVACMPVFPSQPRIGEATVRRASTVIRISCLMVPLVFAWGCASSSGSAAGSKPVPDKADQALAAAQNALQEAKSARASADAALQEARGNRAKLDEILTRLKSGGGSTDAALQALEAARAANQTAQEAKTMAQQAQQSADKLVTRQDRMFEKGMRK
jgi:hypothetical protein